MFLSTFRNECILFINNCCVHCMLHEDACTSSSFFLCVCINPTHLKVWAAETLSVSFCVMAQDHTTKEKALHTMSSMSSAQIVTANAMHHKAVATAAGLAGLRARRLAAAAAATSPAVSYPPAAVSLTPLSFFSLSC
jgi:hypothetical protein